MIGGSCEHRKWSKKYFSDLGWPVGLRTDQKLTLGQNDRRFLVTPKMGTGRCRRPWSALSRTQIPTKFFFGENVLNWRAKLGSNLETSESFSVTAYALNISVFVRNLFNFPTGLKCASATHEKWNTDMQRRLPSTHRLRSVRRWEYATMLVNEHESEPLVHGD